MPPIIRYAGVLRKDILKLKNSYGSTCNETRKQLCDC